jgi:hypothetical protein
MQMPNWVYNTVSITGSPELVEQVREMLAQPYETNHKEFAINDDGTQGYKHTKGVHESKFSFWNIQSPTDLDAYYGEEAKTDLDNFAESYKKAMAESNHWYEWNCREWGCKWDASNVELQEPYEANGKLTIGYRFDTAWSPPLEAIAKLSQQYPDLIIEIDYEEEQGWGGNWVFDKGEIFHKEEWDIPNSHEENMSRKDYCWACDETWGDEDYRYDDCPDLTNSPESDTLAQEVV